MNVEFSIEEGGVANEELTENLPEKGGFSDEASRGLSGEVSRRASRWVSGELKGEKSEKWVEKRVK